MARRNAPTFLPSFFSPRLNACAAAVQSALLVGLALGALATVMPQQAHAQAAAPVRSYSIPAGSLDQVLTRFASAAGAELSVDAALTRGKNSNGLNGSFSVQDGFAELLKGQGLQVVRGANGAYALRAVTPAGAVPAAATGAGTTLAQVTVTARADAAGELPAPYAGGQVARGGKVGLLGDRDFMDTPFNVITYTSQTVEDQQARTMADVVENNPAFRSIYTDNDVSMDFNVRGNKVKSLDAAYGGLYGLMLPGVEALERIEVITGANALINGLGPIGGVGGSINQVPKRAGDVPLTRLGVGYVSDSQWGLRADIGRRFGEDNRFGVRFNGVYSDGNTAVSRQSKKVSMAALGLDWRGDQVRLSADFGYRNNESHSPSRTLFVAAGFAIPAPPKSGENWHQSWSYDNSESTNAAARAEVDLTPDVTAHFAAGASRFREAQLFANSSLTSSAGAVTQRIVYWPLYRNSSTAEAGLRGRLVTGPVKHNWSVAASGLSVNNGILLNNLVLANTNIYTPVVLAQPSIAGLAGPADVPKTGATGISGVAVANTISTLDDRIQVTLGVRQQNVKSENFNAVTGATTSVYEKSATTPGVGIVFKAAQNVSVYANYIEGLQQGPVATAGSVNAGQIFAPYVSKQHEAGVKLDLGSFATTFSAYQLTTPNGFTNPTTNIYGINGEQRTRGLEINTFGELVRGVRLLGGLALVDAIQTRTTSGTNDGKQVTGAPKVQLNLGGEWDSTSLPGLSLSARAIHTSGQFVDLANLQSVPAWTRYDAGVRYKTKWNGTPTTIRLNVQNLFNKSYWAAAVDTYLVQSSPRTVQLSAAFDF